jgi:hypothetical protein
MSTPLDSIPNSIAARGLAFHWRRPPFSSPPAYRAPAPVLPRRPADPALSSAFGNRIDPLIAQPAAGQDKVETVPSPGLPPSIALGLATPATAPP